MGLNCSLLLKIQTILASTGGKVSGKELEQDNTNTQMIKVLGLLVTKMETLDSILEKTLNMEILNSHYYMQTINYHVKNYSNVKK